MQTYTDASYIFICMCFHTYIHVYNYTQCVCIHTNIYTSVDVGEVKFVTIEQWAVEFSQLLDDLTQQDGKAITREPNPGAPNYSSWCKLVAIYGTAYTNCARDTGFFTCVALRFSFYIITDVKCEQAPKLQVVERFTVTPPLKSSKGSFRCAHKSRACAAQR